MLPVVRISAMAPMAWWYIDERGTCGAGTIPANIRNTTAHTLVAPREAKKDHKSLLQWLLHQPGTARTVNALLAVPPAGHQHMSPPQQKLEEMIRKMVFEYIDGKLQALPANSAKAQSKNKVMALADMIHMYICSERIEGYRLISSILQQVSTVTLRNPKVVVENLAWLILQLVLWQSKLAHNKMVTEDYKTQRKCQKGVADMILDFKSAMDGAASTSTPAALKDDNFIFEMATACLILHMDTMKKKICPMSYENFQRVDAALHAQIQGIASWKEWLEKERATIQATPTMDIVIFTKIIILASVYNDQNFMDVVFHQQAGTSIQAKQAMPGGFLAAKVQSIPLAWIKRIPFAQRLVFRDMFLKELDNIFEAKQSRAMSPALVETFARIEMSMPWSSEVAESIVTKFTKKFRSDMFQRDQDRPQACIVLAIILELLTYRLFPKLASTSAVDEVFCAVVPLLAVTKKRELHSTMFTLLHKILVLPNLRVLQKVVESGICFEKCESLNRALVQSVVHALCTNGINVETRILHTFLAKIDTKTPLGWSRWTLESFPTEAQDVVKYYEGAAEVPDFAPETVDNLAKTPCVICMGQPSCSHGGILFQAEGSHPATNPDWQQAAQVFLAEFKLLLPVLMYHNLRHQIINQKISYLLHKIPAFDMSECSRGIVEYILQKFGGTEHGATYRPYLVTCIRAIVWTHQLIRFEVLIFDLTRANQTNKLKIPLCLQLLKDLLVDIVQVQEANPYDAVRKNFADFCASGTTSGDNWQDTFASTFAGFPDDFEFERVTDNATPQTLPKYYGNKWTRLIPAIHRAIVFLLELPPDVEGRLDILTAICNNFAVLYRFNDQRLAELQVLLQVYHRKFSEEPQIKFLITKFFVSEGDLASRFTPIMKTYIEGDGTKPVEGISVDYLRQRLDYVSDAMGHRLSVENYDPQEVDSIAYRAIQNMTLELLVVSSEMGAVVEQLVDIALETPSVRTINSLAHVLRMLPNQPVEEILAQRVCQVINTDASLKMEGIGYKFDGSLDDQVDPRGKSRPRLLCTILHALWLHSCAQRKRLSPMLQVRSWWLLCVALPRMTHSVLFCQAPGHVFPLGDSAVRFV